MTTRTLRQLHCTVRRYHRCTRRCPGEGIIQEDRYNEKSATKTAGSVMAHSWIWLQKIHPYLEGVLLP
mgnify:CR=1 FL=1